MCPNGQFGGSGYLGEYKLHKLTLVNFVDTAAGLRSLGVNRGASSGDSFISCRKFHAVILHNLSKSKVDHGTSES